LPPVEEVNLPALVDAAIRSSRELPSDPAERQVKADAEVAARRSLLTTLTTLRKGYEQDLGQLATESAPRADQGL
jgi:hypothetical protein